MGKTESARAALNRVRSLHPDFHEGILAELSKEGLLDDPHGNGGEISKLHAVSAADKPQSFRDMRRDTVLTLMQAAENRQNLPLLQTTLGLAKRLGVADIVGGDMSKRIDTLALNKALQGKDLDDRWRLKESLYLLHAIAP